jgi:hypothetical protein
MATILKEVSHDVRSFSMKSLKIYLAVLLVATIVVPPGLIASNHREAPITALDHKADITDVYAFVSYGANQSPNTPPSKVTFILCVDPFLEPANGPTWFPFDPDILYEIHVDNDHDALADVSFQVRFQTQYQLPGVYSALAGIGDNGANAPGTSTLVVPPQIRDFNNPGLNLRQTYTVTMVKYRHNRGGTVDDDQDADDVAESVQLTNSDGSPFFAVPANAGPRTIDYDSLYDKGTYHLNDGISVFAGTVDDPFWIDLGATFDTANFRTLPTSGGGTGIPGVLSDAEDSAKTNFTSDTVSGYGVNAIALEVPIQMLTRTGKLEAATSPDATIGMWGTTSRPRVTIRRSPNPALSSGPYRQVQREGNPLINELVIGIGSKDRFSMDRPKNDSQFASFFLDPPIAHIVEALYAGALKVPAAPRTDLLPLVTYAPPIAAPGTPTGPVADMLRLNTGVAATPLDSATRLGLIGGDAAGYPNGRRLYDDVVDITLRVAVGGVLIPAFNHFPNSRLGDGVNVNDAPYRTQFPYLADCPSGRNRRHIDPGEPGGGPLS